MKRGAGEKCYLSWGTRSEQATTGEGAAEQDGATEADGTTIEEWEKKAERGEGKSPNRALKSSQLPPFATTAFELVKLPPL